jgi:uncharacterized oxidoreductase
MNIKGNTILITGGGSGIGLALALEFLKNDNKVIICGRNSDKLQKVKKNHPAIEIIICDVEDNEQVKNMAAVCINNYGGINVLVNNAGVFKLFNYAEGPVSIEEQLTEINIDFAGPIRVTNFFIPQLLKKNNSTIVNVSSGLVYVPLTLGPVYSATKAAIHAWTRSLRWQFKDTSLKIIELMPPLVDTDLISDEFRSQPMMKPEKLAQAFMIGFQAGHDEILPGQSKLLKLMSRLAPKFIFKKLNESFI